MPSVTVGVDAGGTSTIAALARNGAFVRTHSGPAANASSRGVEAASQTIAATILSVLDGASPDAIAVGAAGAGRDDVARAIESSLRSRFALAKITVRDDASIALRAAVSDGDGVALIAGTGSIGYAERAGTPFRSGGFGYLLGDEGSGFSIGQAAVKTLLRAYDGRVPRDAFVVAVERALDVSDAPGALARMYGDVNPVTAIASLAPLVLDAANAGERAPTKIVQTAALELGDLVKAVVRKADLNGAAVPIAFAGGLLRRNSILTYLLETRLQNDYPHMPIRKDAVEPYAGALRAAEHLLHA
ncbi:MAG TPA: BadF/BadG/BcrA/BcrD ATPase family protein [Candidatus Baltobacteraceae bacterium]|jgi:N-acetylglucosamine kinase-like BadF-type ATPase